MSRILLVDDSSHAQRIGERILAEEGYEVVTVSTGDSALVRLEDVDPDVVVADTVMPGRTGYDICHYVKLSPRHRHVRVILTAGMLDALEETELVRVGADGSLRKPFEATALVAAVKPLAEAAAAARSQLYPSSATVSLAGGPHIQKPSAPFVAVLDDEQVRAAVTIALDAAMGSMVDEITARVLAVLTAKRASSPAAAAVPDPAAEASPAPEMAAPKASSAPPRTEPLHRAAIARARPGSILGIELAPIDTDRSEPSVDRR
jgi:CheY-like chemotaxis protein